MDNDFRMSLSVEGRRRLESGASVTVTRFVGRSQSLTAGATGELIKDPLGVPSIMAKRSKRTMKRKTTEPAVTSLWYNIPTGTTKFVDLAADLSRLNRKLFRQGYQYIVAGVSVTDSVDATNQALDVSISTAGNTWVTHNAWVKGKALWDQMNEEALHDNPSIQGTWADYKVSLVENMAFANTERALNGASGLLAGGYEWAKSTYVLPQHDVDAAGVVLPAEEYTACLVGPDDLPNKVFSLVNAYEESRATVQDFNSPNVPVALPDSFYLKLTDDGSQDPELAAIIVDANDQPPYAMTAGAYPGGSAYTAAESVTRVARGVKNEFTPTMTLPGFTAECGLLQITCTRPLGEPSTSVRVCVHLIPGSYRGVMAIPMGQ